MVRIVGRCAAINQNGLTGCCQAEKMLLDGVDEIPSMTVSLTTNAARQARGPGASPDHRATFCLLETQRHIRAILFRPNDQGFCRVIQSSATTCCSRSPRERQTLLLLIAIILGDLGLEQHAVGLIFRFDEYPRLLLIRQQSVRVLDVYAMRAASRVTAAVDRRPGRGHGMRAEHREEIAYSQGLPRAETRSPVKPVIIPQFVDLDSFATVGRLQVQRHDPEGRQRGASSLRASSGRGSEEERQGGRRKDSGVQGKRRAKGRME